MCDPCYIKEVVCRYNEQEQDLRFDALRTVKVLHDGDDGCFSLLDNNNKLCSLGVDSGRIWAMVSEFDCEVLVDSGFSGEYVKQFSSEEEAEKFIDGLSAGE